MTKRAWAVILALLLCVAPLAGCGEESALARRVDTMLEGGDKGREAQRLLMEDTDDIYPTLLKWLESDDGVKSGRAVSAFIRLGEDARQYLLRSFSTMSEKARPLAVKALAAPADKQAVLRLISLMRFSDARDAIVAAIVEMGEPAAQYLAGQLHSAHYSGYVDEALAAFGETAVPFVVPALQSENGNKAGRAIGILMAIGESAVPGMVSGLLAGGCGDDALALAGATLSRYPDVAIPAILDAVCAGTGTVETAVRMLSSLSPDNWPAIFSYQPQSDDAGTRGQALTRMVAALSPGVVLDLALADDSEALWEGVAMGLSGDESFCDPTMVEILSRIGQSGDSDARLETAALRFLPEERTRELVRSLSAGDAGAFRTLAAAQDAEGLAWLGAHLSMVSGNETIYDRCAAALEGTAGAARQALLNAYASGTGGRLPALVMSELSNADAACRLAALSALSQVADSGGSAAGFLEYAGLDYAAYLDGWIGCLSGDDPEIRDQAGAVLRRVPPGSANHGFFLGLFEAVPSQYVLEVLSGHYWEENGLSAKLTYPPGAEEPARVATVALDVSGAISGVAGGDAPDLAGTARNVLETLGLEIVGSAADADLLLDIEYTGQPLHKFYPGMSKTSYSGARFTLTLRTTDGTTELRGDIGCTLPPPDAITVSDATEYLPDPADAPLTDCFRQALIDGLYRLFGEEALFVLYRDFPDAVLPVAQPLWQGAGGQ